MRFIAISTLLLALALALAPGCGKGKSRDGGGSGSTGSAALPAQPDAAGAAAPDGDSIDSKDILARTTVARESFVHNVQLAWAERQAFYEAAGGQLDDRAKGRDRAAAAKLAKELLAQLQAKPDSIGELIQKHSEDPNARTGDPFRVEPGGGFPGPFINLALRLREQEAGIVATDYGFHVVIRVAKPPQDPLESAEILKREQETPPLYRQKIVIGWDQRPANTDPRARARKKADADALAKDLLAKVRGKEDMSKLMKQHSEDPATKDDAAIEKIIDDQSTDPVDRLTLRMKIGEAGIVRSALGWTIVKRVGPPPPPPPDKLESRDILKRKREAGSAKVKHILVGWAEVNGGDNRAKNRSRAQLEKLVPEILEKAKTEPFEKLMIAYSEDDPKAVKSGDPYEVMPDSQLVLPFIELSLRLKVGEIGVVRTEFGLHIIKRTE